MRNPSPLDSSSSDSFASAMRRFFASVPFEIETETAALSMRIDLAEKEGAYVLKADIPGVRKDDIQVRIDGRIVRINAQVRRDREVSGECERVLRSERCWGHVSRSISLAQEVDDAKVQSRYADGVLVLELPKKAAAAPKRIAVQ